MNLDIQKYINNFKVMPKDEQIALIAIGVGIVLILIVFLVW